MFPVIDVIKQAAVCQNSDVQTLVIHLAASLCPFFEDTPVSTYRADWAFTQGKAKSVSLQTCTPHKILLHTLKSVSILALADLHLESIDKQVSCLSKIWLKACTCTNIFCNNVVNVQHICWRILAGAGTALCMLLKSLPHLPLLTPAARVLELMMVKQHEDARVCRTKECSFQSPRAQ